MFVFNQRAHRTGFYLIQDLSCKSTQKVHEQPYLSLSLFSDSVRYLLPRLNIIDSEEMIFSLHEVFDHYEQLSVAITCSSFLKKSRLIPGVMLFRFGPVYDRGFKNGGILVGGGGKPHFATS